MISRVFCSTILLGVALVTQAHADWQVQPVSSLHKLTATSPGVLEPFKAEPVQLRAARGEWESFQIVVTAGETPIQKLELLPTSLSTVKAELLSSQNISAWRENYVFVAKPSGNRELRPLWWPDALFPLNLAPQGIEAGKSAVFWVTVRVPQNAAPGDYFGEIDLRADGQPRRLAVTLQVENVVMPPPSIRGTVAMYYDTLRDWYAKNANKTYTDAEWEAQKRRYYDFLLDYRINAYDLPVSWKSEAAATYLKDPRVHSVRTPALDSPDFEAARAKLAAVGPNAQKKAFYYWIDEPAPERWPEVRQNTQKLRALGIKHLVTVHPNQALKDAVDIWCPNIGDFFGIGHLDVKALEAERKKGRETWMYTMVEPKYPYPTWLLDDDAESIRAYGAIMARYGLNGFVYSMAHGWGPKPLENLQSFANTHGDGTLLYPSEIVGGVGPMPSIRLMLLRDALEDAELMKAAWSKSPLTKKDDNSDILWDLLKFDRAWALNVLSGPQVTQDESKLMGFGFGIYPIGTNKLAIEATGLAPTVDGVLSDASWSQKGLVTVPFSRGDAEAKEEAPLPTTKLWLRRDRKFLYAAFRANTPQESDYVALEIAPTDIEKFQEKLRFIVTQKGNIVVERYSREGRFRVEVPNYKAAVKNFPGYYNVEMQIPLTVLEGDEGFRVDALRRTAAPATGAKVTLYTFSKTGDPYLMPIVSLPRPVVVPPAKAPTRSDKKAIPNKPPKANSRAPK